MQIITVTGQYSLREQSRRFGGFAHPAGEDSAAMAFPVEGWTHAAAVTLAQTGEHTIEGRVVGGRDDDDRPWRQALAVLSLDIDATGYAEVGERDPVIGRLQRENAYLRPVLFHSPYEAACAFVIGHRIRIDQGRTIRARMAREHGETIDVDETAVHAFPPPQDLLELGEVGGLNAEKVRRLHGVAEAALNGRLDRESLRAMPVEDALAQIRTIRGIGAFFAVGIVLRGAGLVDAVPDDDITRAGIRRFYDAEDEDTVTRRWRPFRTWCAVLIHSAERDARG